MRILVHGRRYLASTDCRLSNIASRVVHFIFIDVLQSINPNHADFDLMAVHLLSRLVLKYTSEPGSQSIHAFA